MRGIKTQLTMKVSIDAKTVALILQFFQVSAEYKYFTTIESLLKIIPLSARTVFRLQILKSKVDPHTERIKIYLMVVVA